MKVFSINPNTGKYFEDNTRLCKMDSLVYNGNYKATPVYPLYTLATNGRYDYTNPTPLIEFNTMLPIKKLFGNYFVEVSFRHTIDPLQKTSFEVALEAFRKFCQTKIKNIDIKNLTQ